MAIARVQSTSANSGAGQNNASLVLTFSNPTTAGNTVIVGIASGTSAVLKVTSAHGIFYQTSSSVQDSTGATEYTYIFYAPMTGADTVITVVLLSVANFANMCAVAVEYSGNFILPDAIPAGVAASATNACNTGNITNANANALYVGVIGVKMQSSTVNTNWATNNIAPFTIVAQTTTNNGTTTTSDRAIVYLDAIVATSSSRGTNVNHGYGTNRYAGLLATFDQAASGGGGLRTAGHGGLAA